MANFEQYYNKLFRFAFTDSIYEINSHYFFDIPYNPGLFTI